MEKIEVTYSWTIDFATWDCPKCGYTNEINDFINDNGCCQNCNFQIPNYFSKIGATDSDIIEIYEFENEEE